MTAKITDSPGGAIGDPAAGRVAEVRATYRFRPGPDSLRLTAIRVADTELTITGPGDALRWRLDTLPGLLRLRVTGRDADRDPPGSSGADPVRDAPARGAPGPGSLDSLSLSWSVSGPLRRLPLFVPETPTRPARSRVRLVVRGEDLDVAAGRAFPRMERADGRLVGRPENLPSFLLLPPSGPSLTVDRAADWSVVLLVLVATGWWAAWRRREASESARPAE